jgi:ribosomal protein S18 acetylase RimI-like enzyme
LSPGDLTDHLPVVIRSGGRELLDHIKPLWLALRLDHLDRFPLWRESLLLANFDDRMAEVLRKAASGILVLLGECDRVTVSFCVCTVGDKGQGEIDSIYVAPSHQHRGVGTELMDAAIAWLTERGVKDISVDVMAGNDEALKLYANFGFRPRTIRLRRL